MKFKFGDKVHFKDGRFIRNGVIIHTEHNHFNRFYYEIYVAEKFRDYTGWIAYSNKFEDEIKKGWVK